MVTDFLIIIRYTCDVVSAVSTGKESGNREEERGRCRECWYRVGLGVGDGDPERLEASFQCRKAVQPGDLSKL